MKTAVQTAFFMVVLTFVSKCFGFLREMVMANYFGASYITDAYVMSSNILSVLFGGLISSISNSYIPIYSKITERKGKKEGDIFTSKVIFILLVITIMISIIGVLFSSQIISIFVRGFSGETAKLASFFVKILFSYIIFSATAGIIQSYMQYKGIFLPQIVTGYFVSICAIGSIIISAKTSYYFLPFGLLIGYILRCAAMAIIASKKCGLNLSMKVKPDSSIRDLSILAVPTFISSYMIHINQYIDKMLASHLVEGSISALNYAALLNTMIMGVTITILSTIIYPKLIKANSLNQSDKTNYLISKGINIIFIFALPCSLACMLYNTQIIQIVYERGAFDPKATYMTSSAFLYYSAGLLFMSINVFFTRIFYSMHNTRTPMIIAGIAILINIILNLILVKYMAHNGLALATSIATTVNFLLAYYILNNKYKIIIFQDKIKIFKIVLTSVISIALSYLVFSLSATFLASLFLRGIITAFIASSIYAFLLLLFKVDEIYLVKQLFKR